MGRKQSKSPTGRTRSKSPAASTGRGGTAEVGGDASATEVKGFTGKNRRLMSFIGGGGGAEQETRKPAIKFDSFPLWLREGPWKWTAWAYITWFMGMIVYQFPTALASLPRQLPTPNTEYAGILGVCCFWNAYILYTMFRDVGWYPLISFTMLSWIILFFRLASLVLAPYSPAISWVGEFLHGTAILNAVQVFSIWWFVLTPLITMFMKEAKHREWFIKFNFSFFLLNVHAGNLVLAYVVCKVQPRPFLFFDLWCALLFSVVYLIFYQTILDPRGIHLYIILSPRTHFCVVSYSMLIATFVGAYWAVGGDMTQINDMTQLLKT